MRTTNVPSGAPTCSAPAAVVRVIGYIPLSGRSHGKKVAVGSSSNVMATSWSDSRTVAVASGSSVTTHVCP